MSNISLIIAREYLTRVKKKSFIILTILLPILLAALIVVPVLLVIHHDNSQHTNVLVVDDTEVFINGFQDTKNITFQYCSGNIDELKKEALKEKNDVVFHILDNTQALKSNLYYNKNFPSNLESELENQMNEIFFNRLLQDSLNIAPERFTMLEDLTKVDIATIQIDDEGNEHENQAEVNQIIGMLCGLFIYFIIIIFASQVLRGVLEEKTNRIVEVLISSVKPIQLLTGKIIGIALVGITQFMIWIVLTLGILLTVQIAAPSLFDQSEAAEMALNQTDGIQAADVNGVLADTNIFQQINNYFAVSFTEIILCFFFFFIVGYLIYATLYAATGSVVDNESDSQQYTMPVTLPLLLSIVVVSPVATNPNGQLAFWMSMIPLTSPISMMVRLPSGVPSWQLGLSMGLALLFLAFSIWFASKIYRVGILMYGKKLSWKEILKWLKKA